MADQGDTAVTTLNDIDVACRLYDALAQHAASTGGAPITHADLLTLARLMYPKDVVLGRAVPLGIPAKLAFLASFCAAQGFPDLACVAVNGRTQQPVPPFQGDWAAARLAVAGADWAGAHTRLLAYADQVRATVPRRFKPRKERPADVAWYAYFCSHREACAQLTGEDKKEIINLLMAGLDPETALRRVSNVKAALGAPA
jgi:hypothetical protein